MLMENFKCDNFSMYYDNDYDIVKIINLIYNQDLDLTSEQLTFLKTFFTNIKNALIVLFDMKIKPIINNTVDSSISNSNSMNNAFQSKPRIIN